MPTGKYQLGARNAPCHNGQSSDHVVGTLVAAKLPEPDDLRLMNLAWCPVGQPVIRDAAGHNINAVRPETQSRESLFPLLRSSHQNCVPVDECGDSFKE